MVELPLRSLNAKFAMPGLIVASSRPSVYGCASVRDPAIEQIVDRYQVVLRPETSPISPSSTRTFKERQNVRFGSLGAYSQAIRHNR
jgi:hypothetical protein